jgi:hypothetical protein
VEAEDEATGMSKSVLYSFTDECKLADCEVRDDQWPFVKLGRGLMSPVLDVLSID